jgi:hypothetical protein
MRRVKDYTKRAGELAPRRNSVLHALWVHDQPYGEMVALKDVWIETRKAPTRAADLHQLALDVGERRKKRAAFLLSCYAARTKAQARQGGES